MDHPTAPPGAALAADWITVWRCEWAGVAADRETPEASQRTLAAWAAQANADMIAPTADDAASRRARPIPPPRPAAAPDAPEARDVFLASLLDRVAELERRTTVLASDPAATPAQP